MSTPIQDLNILGQAGSDEKIKEDNRSQAEIDYAEGRGYVERGESALAAVSLHNALRGFEEADNKEGIANASNQLGHTCMQRNEFETALKHYRRAWGICEALNDQMSLQSLSRQFVDAYKGLGEYRKSLDVCLELIDEYQNNNDPRGTVEVMEKMAEVYLAAGESSKAADTYETVASIHANFKHHKIAESFRSKARELTTKNT